MIGRENEIIDGMVVQHEPGGMPGGLLYWVDGVQHSTAGYETVGDLPNERTVSYVQLLAGECAVGAAWSKPEKGFRHNFTIVPNLDNDPLQILTRDSSATGVVDLAALRSEKGVDATHPHGRSIITVLAGSATLHYTERRRGGVVPLLPGNEHFISPKEPCRLLGKAAAVIIERQHRRV